MLASGDKVANAFDSTGTVNVLMILSEGYSIKATFPSSPADTNCLPEGSNKMVLTWSLCTFNSLVILRVFRSQKTRYPSWCPVIMVTPSGAKVKDSTGEL